MKRYTILILLAFCALHGASNNSHAASSSDAHHVAPTARDHAAAAYFEKALSIIHAHIDALQRNRKGNPKHNKEELMEDYQTLSAIIRSLAYHFAAGHPLKKISFYKPRVIHYRDATTLEWSKNYAFDQINKGINIIQSQLQADQGIIQRLQNAMSLLNSDMKNVAPREQYLRERVAAHKRLALSHIEKLKAQKTQSTVGTSSYDQETSHQEEIQIGGQQTKRTRETSLVNDTDNKKQKTSPTVPVKENFSPLRKVP